MSFRRFLTACSKHVRANLEHAMRTQLVTTCSFYACVVTQTRYRVCLISNSNLFSDLQSEKHRRMLYSMEMEQMAENAKTQMEDVSHIQTDFVTATQIGHVKTMFKVR